MERIDLIVKERTRTSEIFIGFGLLEFLVEDLKERPLGNRLGILTDTRVEEVLGSRLHQLSTRAGLRTDLIAFSPGEKSKQWETIQTIFEELLVRGFDRKSVLMALGGGVVGDVAGFVASLYMRSIPYVQVPTTLLAQVDSSLGGKNGIDLPHGKNLLGTFYQPHRVYIDPATLESLPASEFQNGLAEVVKSAVVRDPELFDFLDANSSGVLERQLKTLRVIIGRCCRIKTKVVMADEKDKAVRQILNFGHTVGHALEAHTDYRLPHGTAVSVGMAAETILAAMTGDLTSQAVQRILGLLKRYGLPTRIPKDCDVERIIDLMHADKKADDGRIAIVSLTGIGEAVVRQNVSIPLIREALREVQA